MNPTDRKYTKEHEWIKLEEGSAGLLGITHFAQEQLGDVVYLDLPQVGTQLNQHAKFGEVESVKTVSDLYIPVSGKVIEVNQNVMDHPEVVNEDPYGRGWILRVELQDPSELDGLLTAEQYEAVIQETST
jgi:glycine cleavage system H protein